MKPDIKTGDILNVTARRYKKLVRGNPVTVTGLERFKVHGKDSDNLRRVFATKDFTFEIIKE